MKYVFNTSELMKRNKQEYYVRNHSKTSIISTLATSAALHSISYQDVATLTSCTALHLHALGVIHFIKIEFKVI